MNRSPRDRASRRTLAVLLGVLGGLLTVAAFTPRQSIVAAVGVTPGEAAELVLEDPALQAAMLNHVMSQPELRSALEARLAAVSVDSVYDVHLDPDVGRILQPNLAGRELLGKELSTNQYGLRERRFAWRKPKGVTRVILLGDSYIYGYGIEAHERVGVHLERILGPHCPTPKLEVLHFGVSSWNLQSECAFLLRQLGALDPDLVVQVGFVNDIGDTMGARGIGVMGRFSPQANRRGEAAFTDLAMQGFFPGSVRNHLHRGLDWESRTRIQRAGEHVMELADALDRAGTPYLFVPMFEEATKLMRELMVPDLDENQLGYVSLAFRREPSHWNSEQDRHWNPLASERMALGLYGLIRERGLLDGWELPPDADADDWHEQIFNQGARDAADASIYAEFVAQPRITSEFVFPPVDRPMGMMATGGVDKDGVLSHYASFCMARAGREVVVDLETLDRAVLDGTEATVYLDEFEVGRVPLDDPDGFPARFAIPAALDGREHLSVRFDADQFAYVDFKGAAGIARVRSIRFE